MDYKEWIDSHLNEDIKEIPTEYLTLDTLKYLNSMELTLNVANIIEIILDNIKNDNDEIIKYYESEIFKSNNGNLMYGLGYYYDNNRKFKEAKKYYKIAIQNDHIYAMYCLGFLYDNNGNNRKAKKYYRMAIQKGHVYAMYQLGTMYNNNANYKKAKKYYLMAIQKGNVSAMNNLGVLYHNIGKYKKTIKYYKMAIQNGLVMTMDSLGQLYESNGNHIKAIKYFEMAIKNGYDSKHNLSEVLKANQDILIQYIEKKIEHTQRIAELEEYATELEYRPNGIGYERAKEEFESLQKK